MKKILFLMAIMMVVVSTAFAQVPTVMMYQVQVKHGKSAAQDVSIRMEVRTSQTGSAIWSQTFDLKEVKNGSVQNLGLDFGSKVDLQNGEYWLATIVDGEEKGCAKLQSVPYAIVAKQLEGIATKDELVGTWKTEVEKDEYTDTYSLTFNADGTTSFSKTQGYWALSATGKWELLAGGTLYYDVIAEESRIGSTSDKDNYSYKEEKVVPIHVVKSAGKLILGGGDNFYGDNLVVYKDGNSNPDDDGDNTIGDGSHDANLVGTWIGTIIEDDYKDYPIETTLVINDNGSYTMNLHSDLGANNIEGEWKSNNGTIILTNAPYESCQYTISHGVLSFKGDGFTASFQKK